MKPQKEKAENKLPYEKPMLREIELAAEEVLGVGCKIEDSPASVPDMLPCRFTACDQEGT